MSSNVSIGKIAGIAIAILVGIAVVIYKDRPAPSEDVDYMMDQLDTLQEEQTRLLESGSSDTETVTFEASESATGSARVMQEWVADVFNASMDSQKDYISELESVGWMTILDGDRLQRDSGQVESAEIIASARIVAEKYEKQSVQQTNDARDQLNKLDISAAEKRTALSAYDERIAASQGARGEIWTLEHQIIDDIEQIVAKLGRSEGRWSVQDSQVLFETQEDADEYNLHFNNMLARLERQESIRQELVDDAKESVRDK
ncbi:MAG: hypothetical protein ACR2QT_04685 [Woeseiaceae bacterium]